VPDDVVSDLHMLKRSMARPALVDRREDERVAVLRRDP
jgi:hypothetical protein